MTRLTQGSGMGLYLTKSMIEKMNGSISVESKDEHTIFFVTFPIATVENIMQSKIKSTKRGENA